MPPPSPGCPWTSPIPWCDNFAGDSQAALQSPCLPTHTPRRRASVSVSFTSVPIAPHILQYGGVSTDHSHGELHQAPSGKALADPRLCPAQGAGLCVHLRCLPGQRAATVPAAFAGTLPGAGAVKAGSHSLPNMLPAGKAWFVHTGPSIVRSRILQQGPGFVGVRRSLDKAYSLWTAVHCTHVCTPQCMMSKVRCWYSVPVNAWVPCHVVP